MRDDGMRDDGMRDDGMRDDGMQDDGMQDDGMQDDGMRNSDTGGAPVRIYYTDGCGYCQRARRLLDRKGVRYEAIDVGHSRDARSEMTRLAGGRHTVPQIFVGDRHLGGCDDLHDLEATGDLDEILRT